MWCSGGCSWKCYKTLTYCSLLRRCTIPCDCHVKRALNVQKWSVRGVVCTFWLRNLLRATTACSFSTSQLLKMLRSWSVLYILTSKCASRHNGVRFFDISTSKSGPALVYTKLYFFISHLARWLRARRFSEPTFRPSGAALRLNKSWTSLKQTNQPSIDPKRNLNHKALNKIKINHTPTLHKHQKNFKQL